MTGSSWKAVAAGSCLVAVPDVVMCTVPHTTNRQNRPNRRFKRSENAGPSKCCLNVRHFLASPKRVLGKKGTAAVNFGNIDDSTAPSRRTPHQALILGQLPSMTENRPPKEGIRPQFVCIQLFVWASGSAEATGGNLPEP
ncbi:hypothetical protein BU16DRAFT_538752 [Lophium mytilinum]|uniref:Secreted protein n=1 Tax=Lophium mytilinum TaxID=390894 RepID=A0A6A6QVI7_9PEZI|nr:hypothetical protein BU16DRAFT_538752 [Lophium mytilinum]